MNAPLSIGEREASSLALLGSLVREVWPKVMQLPQNEVDAIPAPVISLLTTMWGMGVRDLLPHEAEIDDARSRAEWAELVQKSQAKVLDRLAEAADAVYAAKGGSKTIVYNALGYPVRQYGRDLDAVLSNSAA